MSRTHLFNRAHLVIAALLAIALGALAFACGSNDDGPGACEGATCADGGDDESSPLDGGFDSSTDQGSGDAVSDGNADAAETATTCSGQPGSFDPTFGDGGAGSLNYSGSAANSVVIQTDGKAVLGGYIKKTFALARLTTNGLPDTTFGDGGVVETSISARSLGVAALAVQPDSKLVAVGSAALSANLDFVVVRYGPGGIPDPTFGTGGVASAAFGSDAIPASVVVLAGGKILVGGKSGDPASAAGTDYALARFNADGTLDGTFGSGGTTTVDVRSSEDSAGVMAVQSDGKIILAGGSTREPARLVSDASLVRFNPNGSLDATFGTGGKVVTNFGSVEQIAGPVAFDSSGRIVVAGTSLSAATGYDVALFRLSAAGVLDMSLGAAGLVTTDLGGDEGAGALFIQPDGKFVTVGNSVTQSGTSTSIAIVRYRPDYTLDPAFGVGGKVITTAIQGFMHISVDGAALGGCTLTVASGWQPSSAGPVTTWIGAARYRL